MPQSKYPGDFDGKRVARAHLYCQARDVFDASYWPKGWAVTLVANEAAEVGAMRHLLRWDPRRVLFVDKLPEGPEKAKRKWPQAQACHADLREVLPYLKEGIGFINLDFMGYMNKEVEDCLRLVGPYLNPGAFVAFTFARGRENLHSQRYVESVTSSLQKYLELYPNVAKLLSSQDRTRLAGYFAKTVDLLNLPSLHIAGSMLYRSRNRGVSMGSVYLHNLPAHHRTEEWREAICQEGANDHILHRITDPKDRLREISADLEEEFSPWAVREILHL